MNNAPWVICFWGGREIELKMFVCWLVGGDTCVCVCVRKRERARERARPQISFIKTSEWRGVLSYYPCPPPGQPRRDAFVPRRLSSPRSFQDTPINLSARRTDILVSFVAAPLPGFVSSCLCTATPAPAFVCRRFSVTLPGPSCAPGFRVLWGVYTPGSPRKRSVNRADAGVSDSH